MCRDNSKDSLIAKITKICCLLLEFFLVKWALQEFIKAGNQNHKSCEMIAVDILENHLIPLYGNRAYTVVVSEDGESDGIIEFVPQL